MINSVRLDTRIARQQLGHKQLGEAGLIVEHTDHGRLLTAHNRGCAQCGGDRHTFPLPDEAAFSKEAALLQDPDHCFFPLCESTVSFTRPAWT